VREYLAFPFRPELCAVYTHLRRDNAVVRTLLEKAS
jgi:hypothetical protein